MLGLPSGEACLFRLQKEISRLCEEGSEKARKELYQDTVPAAFQEGHLQGKY
jgi:hypothetical protein